MNNLITKHLPNIEEATRHNPSDSYGASDIARKYCRIKYLNKPTFGEWQHGVKEPHRSFHPTSITGSHRGGKKSYYWVARKDQEDYLKQNGYKNVKAIGLPITYIPEKKIKRSPDSLLVMPVHSMDYTTHSRNSENYAKTISDIRSKFSNVVICVHPSCQKNGYWINAFKDYGFDIITGAILTDKNALRRIHFLLSSFEYMTTNSPGSHLAYGAFCGSKVSIFGKYETNNAEDFDNDPFYTLHPHLLKPTIEAYSLKTYQKHFPNYFCHPLDAKKQKDLGRYLVGFDNKISSKEMQHLFQWDIKNRIYYHLIHELKRIKRKIFQII